jgi:hypothetical protein
MGIVQQEARELARQTAGLGRLQEEMELMASDRRKVLGNLQKFGASEEVRFVVFSGIVL